MTVLISHIPKTAGTSLKRLVERFHPDATFVYDLELALANPDLEFISRFRRHPTPIVMGHFSYGAHRLLGVAPAYVTLLREPVARIISLYRYQRSRPEAELAGRFRAGMSLLDFVASGITEMTNNHMCRVIAGIPPEAGPSISERWLLDLALHNLRRHYVLAGTCEGLGGFLSRLGAMLNWGKEVAIPRENEARGDSVELDDRAYEAIVERNRLDIELFGYVSRNSGDG